MVSTPVLFITFARPSYAQQVFEQIKRAKPAKFYFYNNKGRDYIPDEIEGNRIIRSWVEEIDWPCEVYTFFRESYVDVYESTRGAMDWVFSCEEKAIILEEDSVPSIGFFEYCDHFIELYENNEKIGYISGNNYCDNKDLSSNTDHIVSVSQTHFGWATWRDRWKSLDFNILPSTLIRTGSFDNYFKGVVNRWYYKTLFMELEPFIKRTKCWDFIWTLNSIRNGWYEVNPLYNLVHNVGVVGIHTNGIEEGVFRIECDLNKHYTFLGNVKSTIIDYDFDRKQLKRLGNIDSFKSYYLLIVRIIKYLTRYWRK